MAKKKKTYVIEADVLQSIKRQVAKYYDAETWEELIVDGYIDFDESEMETVWQRKPSSVEKFVFGEILVVPYCTLIDGGEPIAEINLEVLRHIEYQQTNVKIYRKMDVTQISYLMFSGEDSDLPVLFRW